PHGHVLPHSYPLLARRQPPLSTPFPYTTLFRSAARPAFRNKRSLTLWFMSTRKKRMPLRAAFWFGKYENPDGMDVGQPLPVSKRSEEHTSELQSRENLVCRLLLEKKKKKTYGGA